MLLYQNWTGSELRWTWRSADHCAAAGKFLEQLLGGPPLLVDGADFFALENEAQYDALLAFMDELERDDRSK